MLSFLVFLTSFNWYRKAFPVSALDQMALQKTATQHFYDGRAAAEDTPPDFVKAYQCWESGKKAGCMPSAVENYCLLWCGAHGVDKRRDVAPELFSIIQSSHNFVAQVQLSQRLQHGACGVDSDHKLAGSLLKRAAILGWAGDWASLAHVLHGRMLLHAGTTKTASVLLAAKMLFKQGSDEGGSIGCAERALLYQYGDRGTQGDLSAARRQLYRFCRLRTATEDYCNDEGDDFLEQRVYELYFGNLLAFGEEKGDRNCRLNTALSVLRAAARSFPQASVLMAFLLDRDSPCDGNAKEAPNPTTLYAEAAPLLWNHVFHFTNDMTRKPRRKMSKFSWNILCNVYANYNYAGYTIQQQISSSAQWPPQMIRQLANNIDVITVFCVAVMVEHGVSPFPLDRSAAKTLFQHAANYGHVGAKEKLGGVSRPLQNSLLEHALAVAVVEPRVLSEDFLRKVLRSDNVTSPSSLISGHNLLLLALRTGVLEEKVINVKGDPQGWNVHEQLYLPGKKLIESDHKLVAAVFKHAEEIGLVPQGCFSSKEFSIGSEGESVTDYLFSAFSNLSLKVSHLRHLLTSNKFNIETLKSHLTNLFRGFPESFRQIERNHREAEVCIRTFSQSLTDLCRSLNAQERMSIYGSLANCMISLMLLVRNACASMLNVEVDLLALPIDATFSQSTNGNKESVHNIAHIDLSNFRVASSIFSFEDLKDQNIYLYNLILQAVERSEFQSCLDIKKALESQVTETTKRGSLVKPNAVHKTVASKGVMGSSWAVSGPFLSGTDSKEAASIYFKYLITSRIVHNVEGRIEPPDALIEINKLLTNDKLQTASGNIFDEIFVERCNGMDMVDEKLFIEIYLHFRDRFRQEFTMDAIMSECEAYVTRKVHSNSGLNLKLADLYLRLFYEEQVRRGRVVSIETSNGIEAPFEAAIRAACGGDGPVSKTAFVNAMVSLATDRIC